MEGQDERRGGGQDGTSVEQGGWFNSSEGWGLCELIETESVVELLLAGGVVPAREVLERRVAGQIRLEQHLDVLLHALKERLLLLSIALFGLVRLERLLDGRRQLALLCWLTL